MDPTPAKIYADVFYYLVQEQTGDVQVLLGARRLSVIPNPMPAPNAPAYIASGQQTEVEWVAELYMPIQMFKDMMEKGLETLKKLGV